MRTVTWMASGSLAAWLVAAVLAPGSRRALFFGVLGPLVAASSTWLVVEGTVRRHPARLTGVLIAAFAVKMVGFAAYLAVMVGVLALRPLPFALSLTCSFVVLHLIEARLLGRLLSSRTRACR